MTKKRRVWPIPGLPWGSVGNQVGGGYIQRIAPPTTTGAIIDITVSDLTGATDMSAEIQAQIGTSGRAYRFPVSGTIRLDTRLTIFFKNNMSFDVRGCSLRSGTALTTAAAARIFDVYTCNNIKIFSSTRTGDVRGQNANPGSLGNTPFTENDAGHMFNVGDSSFVEITGFTSQKAWGDFVQIDLDVAATGLTHDIWVHDNPNIIDVGRSFISMLSGYNVWFERNTLGQCGLQVYNIEPYQADVNIHHVYFLDNNGTQDFAHVVSGPNFGYWANLGNGTLGGTIADIYLERNTCSAKVMQTVCTLVSAPRRARFYIRNNRSTFASTTPLYGHAGVIDMRYIDTLYVQGNLQNSVAPSLVTTSVTDLHE